MACPTPFSKSLRKYLSKKVVFLLILLCIVWLIRVEDFGLKFLWQSRSRSHVGSDIDNLISQVDIMEVEAKKSQKKYVLVLPKRFDIDVYKKVDYLIEVMESFGDYDGATCHGLVSKDQPQKIKSCNFKTRNWTMLISSEYNKKYHRNEDELWICNIVEFPFLIRQTLFKRIGLNEAYGEAMLLDFFLRTNGSLKIAVSRKCVFSKNVSKMHHGPPRIKRQIALDYGLLGHTHNLLRIIRPDSITWTKCSYKTTSCPDIPEQKARADNIVLPYCCKTMVNEILIATTNALNQIGMSYRVCFSTLLGAVRSKTAIPWDGDVDFCLRSDDLNTKTFEKLKQALEPTNFSYAYIFGLNRVVPLNALVKYVSNYSLVKESDLFSEQAIRYMKEMLPVPRPLWKVFPYADFYGYNKIFERKTVHIDIDGLEYPTGENPHELLRGWYGSKYLSTAEKDRVNSAPVR